MDVSHLPTGSYDARSPLWWGNLLLLVIEITMFAILIRSFLYILMNFSEWPPPRVDYEPILYNTNPKLGVATANLLLLLASCIPMRWIDRAARAKNQRQVRIG